MALVTTRLVQAYLSDTLAAQCDQQRPTTLLDSTECLVRSLALVSEQQMSVAQYMYIARHVVETQPCNLLVFGVGGDSPIWLHANRGGRTLFVEQDEKWARLARERSPDIDVLTVDYRTRVGQTEKQMNDIDARYWDFLPESVTRTNWNVILIDAPTAYESAQPGRLQPVWFAARHVAERELAAHVFLHDYERTNERRIGRAFFTLPYKTQPLVVTAPTREQHLAHWALTDVANVRGALARSLHSNHFVAHGRKMALLNVLTQPPSFNKQELACAYSMRAQSERSFLHMTPASAFVSLNFTTDEDGLGEPVGAGNYLSGAEFRNAVLSKTYSVLAALRFSYDILMLDIDVVATPTFDLEELLTRASASVPIVAQQDRRRNQCKFNPNSGFYLARSASVSAAHFHSVARVSRMHSITEQEAWTKILGPVYNPLFAKPCDKMLYEEVDGDVSQHRLVHLLAPHLYPNGDWLERQNADNPFAGELDDARIVHFNYIVGMCKKWDRMRKVLSFIF